MSFFHDLGTISLKSTDKRRYSTSISQTLKKVRNSIYVGADPQTQVPIHSKGYLQTHEYRPVLHTFHPIHLPPNGPQSLSVAHSELNISAIFCFIRVLVSPSPLWQSLGESLPCLLTFVRCHFCCVASLNCCLIPVSKKNSAFCTFPPQLRIKNIIWMSFWNFSYLNILILSCFITLLSRQQIRYVWKDGGKKC